MKKITIKQKLKPRAQDAHKGTFGHVVVLGGDDGMPGAVRLAGEGALRMGAGLVTVITRPEHIAAVVSTRPELLCFGLSNPTPALIKQHVSKASLIILGPGLGQSTWSELLFDVTVLYASQHATPLLIDADGLNWLAKKHDTWKKNNQTILTPHPGEAARLLEITTNEVQANREQAIRALEARFGGVIVLKGSNTLVYTKGQTIGFCQAGNPGMASAGMGDVLSGIIGGLVTQGLTCNQAAALGVLLHAKAGDSAVKKRGEQGLLASDLFLEFPHLLKV